MNLNLQELILFREEVNRELTHFEVDRNFKKVANPWNKFREYYSQDIVIFANGTQLDFWMYYNLSDLIPSEVGKGPGDPDVQYSNTDKNGGTWIKIGTGVGGGGGQGLQGLQGLQGEQGIQGAQGIQGFQGLQGFQGIQGLQGIQGFQGLQGTTGIQGAEGMQGAEGHGIQGFTGQTGETGMQGATGAQGISGEATVYIEATGETFHIYQGIQGIQGIIGLQGETGSQGIQGIVGIQGETGLQGFQGPKGEVIVYNPHEEIVVYQGTQGITGLQGSDGFQGIQGLQGISGQATNQGAQGIQGFQGFQGIQGYQGIQGDLGPQGETGIQGYHGIQGIQGLQGEIGWLGPPGEQGIQGLKGDVGVQGFQGIQGELGLSTYAIYQQVYPSATVQDFFAALQGIQGPRGPEGSGFGCHTSCNDECKVRDTITQFVDSGDTITISFADMLFEIWNDNIRAYVNDKMPSSEMTIEKQGTDVVIEFTAPSNCYINIYYEYFDISMGNYILITPHVFVPVETNANPDIEE